jgi:hypothetical protein
MPRVSGSVRAKAEWLSYSTSLPGAGANQQEQINGVLRVERGLLAALSRRDSAVGPGLL